MEKIILYGIFALLAIIIILNMGFDRDYAAYKARKNALHQQRAAILGQKTGRIEKYIVKESELVSATGTSSVSYLALMALSVILGFLFGKLVFMDTFISLVTAGICIVLPHSLLILKRNASRREVAEHLESAMRLITHEYISCLDIEKAIENAVPNIERDKPFREFLIDSKVVDSNVERNLRRLENREDNIFFSRWIDQLILTQTDHTQLVNLTPILQEMNDAKTAQAHSDTQVASAWREYFTLLFIILVSPLLVRIIQYEWYCYLIDTPIGRLLVVALLASLVWSTGRAMKINTPITG